VLLSGGLLAASATPGGASIALFDYGFNIDGVVSLPFAGDPIPAAVDISGFDTNTGLGDIIVSLTGLGAHYVGLFVDHEIDETTNGFANEDGAPSLGGAPAAGQSWEIDEPGYGSLADGSAGLPYIGDIFSNFSAGSLDEMVFYDAFDDQSLTPPDDVSMAMAWSFDLEAEEKGFVTFMLADVAPTGFHLMHTDPDSLESLYLYSTLRIESDSQGAPLPATAALLLAGLAALGGVRRRRRL
jgi:hypothetical protein